MTTEWNVRKFYCDDMRDYNTFYASQIYPGDVQKMWNKNGKNLIRRIQSEFIARH